MASILAWKSQWTEEPGRLQSMGLQTVMTQQLSTHTHTHRLRDSPPLAKVPFSSSAGSMLF